MAKINMKLKSESDISSESEVEQAPKPENKFKTGQQGECVKCKKQKKILAKGMCSNCYNRSREPNNCCLKCMAVARVGKKDGLCSKCSSKERVKLLKENAEKHRECKRCKETKFISAHGLCIKCYKRSKPKTEGKCQTCGQIKILVNKNVCGTCQAYERAKTDIRMCKNCGKMRSHHADKMCMECYNQTKRLDKSRHKECAKCKKTKFVEARGLCDACYYQSKKEDVTRHKECSKCKKTKFIKGHGLCKACYSKGKRQQLEADVRKHKECVACKQAKVIVAHGMCNVCYQKLKRQAAKHKSAKQAKKSKLIPKTEPISSDEDQQQRSVSPVSLDEFKMEPLTDEELDQRSVSPASIDEDDFKMEPFSDDDQQPGPSWKY